MAKTTTPPPTVGSIIEQKRTANGWTLYELAKQSGVSWGYLRKVIDDPARSPSFETIERLALAFGCPTDDFRTLGRGK